jgi:hypothetical protein
MRFDSEITQYNAVGKQFRQKNEKPAPGEWGNGLVDYWIDKASNWRGNHPIYPSIQ